MMQIVKVNHEKVGKIHKLTSKCPMCGKENVIELTDYQYRRYREWVNGWIYAQDLRFLTPDEMETLMTGTCKECWKKMFPDDEDEGCYEEIADYEPELKGVEPNKNSLYFGELEYK